MADISRLSRLINGVIRGVDLASNELVVNQLKVGGGSGTYLTKTILDKLILTNAATDLDGTFDSRYADIATEGVAAAALPSASFTDAAVTSKLITGYSSGAGVVAATDTILQAVNKLNGNSVDIKATADAALPSASFTDAAVTSKLLTGYSSSSGVVAATDTILQAIGKLNGNIGAAIVGAIVYKGTFDASAGNFDAIDDPKQGWLYKVSVAGTISSVLFSIGDNIYINKDVVGSPVIGDIDLIDNTEAADILRKGALTSGQIFVGSATNEATAVAMSGEATIIASGAVTLANSAVIGKVLTGYTQGAGVIAATDTILQGIQKADGNAAAAKSVADAALPSASFTDAAVTSKLITGFVSGAGVVAATDTILQAVNKLDGNVGALQSGSAALKESMVCGEAYASGLFAVRFAKGAETAGRIYKADFDATTSDNFHVCGLMTSAGKSIADSVDVYKAGLMTVTGHGFTVGLPLFLDAAGVLSQTPSSTALMAVKQVGIVRTANIIEVQILNGFVN